MARMQLHKKDRKYIKFNIIKYYISTQQLYRMNSEPKYPN